MCHLKNLDAFWTTQQQSNLIRDVFDLQVLKMADLVGSVFDLLPNSKKGGLGSLEGLLSLLLRMAKGYGQTLGEILTFICKAMKNEANFVALQRQSVILFFVARHHTRYCVLNWIQKSASFEEFYI